MSRLSPKRFIATLSSFLLLSSSLAAGTGGSTRTVEERIAELEQQLTALQRELSSLKRDLATGPSIETKAGDPASVLHGESSRPLSQQAPAPQAAAAKTEVKPVSPGLKVSGDLRTRFEPTFQDGTPDRYRGRVRARVSMLTDLTDEFSGGVSMASGLSDDPISSNQTMTTFFTRKTLDFDRYFVTYRPKGFKPLTLEAGKFTTPWIKTEMTFDVDLNPEGFNQRFSFDLKNSPLTNVTLVGFELPFNEVAAGPDGLVLGGQLQTYWKPASKVKLGLHTAAIHFRNPDSIARAQALRTLGGSAIANSLRSEGGTVVGFGSRFLYLDLLGQLDVATSERWPVRLLFNLVNNTRAATRHRTAFWSEFQTGRSANPGDLQLGYTYLRIERDAVISAFTYSDIRAGSNVEVHRLNATYQLRKHIVLSFTAFFGQLLDGRLTPTLLPPKHLASGNDPLQTRFHFDWILKF